VVVLHHHLGYQLTEIADTLGIPAGTARSRLHHAVRQLRLALDSTEDAMSGERLA
jgi:RNA polymerase sigma-70 factor (ECF subfamily)